MLGKAGKTPGVLAAQGYALHPLEYGPWDGATLLHSGGILHF